MADIVRDARYCDATGQRIDAAALRCRCKRIVELWDAMTNPCDCGRQYNGSGQELAPVSQWGEETGEQWADIRW